MSFTRVSQVLKRIGYQVSAAVNRVGTAIILVMMLLTTADVLLRYLFNRPILGAYEVTELLMLILVAFGLGYTQSTKRHVFVSVVGSRFPPRGQAINDIVVYLICLGMCALLVWRVVEGGRVQQMANVVASNAVKIPLYPFHYLLALGFVILFLVYIVDLIDAVLRALKK